MALELVEIIDRDYSRSTRCRFGTRNHGLSYLERLSSGAQSAFSLSTALPTELLTLVGPDAQEAAPGSTQRYASKPFQEDYP